jgi:Tfp pilus assembly protein PilV
MLPILCNNKGFSIVEAVIAFFITAVGIIAVMSMQPLSWQTASRSDLLGRAAEIMQRQLEDTELFIMNPNNLINLGTSTQTVHASGENTAQTGDITYTVQTTITDNGNGSWTVAVTVTWPRGNNSISESLIVTRQESFRA